MTEFDLDTNHGPLAATLKTNDSAHAALLFAHGAGADHKHVHMEALANAFATVGIATLRFNFPFKQQARHRVDSKDVSVECIVQAAKVLEERLDLPLFVGGHSFGGRMATHAAAQGLVDCHGLVLCSFPLHPAGKPGTQRAEHFKDIKLPMLFLSGTRDALAEPSLLQGEIEKHGSQCKLHWLDTADHSFKILKRTRKSEVDVYQESAQVAAEFTTAVID